MCQGDVLDMVVQQSRGRLKADKKAHGIFSMKFQSRKRPRSAITICPTETPPGRPRSVEPIIRRKKLAVFYQNTQMPTKVC